jgi:hydroxymethylglutaryl-CoA reductase
MIGLTDQEAETLRSTGALDMETANRMVENVIGAAHIPLGLGLNFLINKKEYLIPMAVEEPSVIAAASNAAKLCRKSGGIKTSSTDPVMIGQMQIVKVPDLEKAKKAIDSHKNELIESLNDADRMLVKFGGGPRDIQTRIIDTKRGKMIIVHLLVDVRDAMGANAVNTMSEKIYQKLEELTGGKVLLKIISNLAVYRMARAEAVWTKEELEESLGGTMKGDDIIEAVLDAYAFADADPYRCATHNKGIMNGIDAVAVATGNDFRAVEAGAHAYAAMNGYKPLTKYEKNKNGDLIGRIELPMVVGTIGGSIKTNPIAAISLKILGVKTSKELGEIMAAVGLAQNFAALRALSTEGLQRGHMKLHAKNIAVMAGAKDDKIDIIAKKMIEEKNINIVRAKEILDSL